MSGPDYETKDGIRVYVNAQGGYKLLVPDGIDPTVSFDVRVDRFAYEAIREYEDLPDDEAPEVEETVPENNTHGGINIMVGHTGEPDHCVACLAFHDAIAQPPTR